MDDKPRIYTTHCLPDKRPKQIGRPAIINGQPAIAYVSGSRIESYLPVEDLKRQMEDKNLPILRVEF